MSSFKEALIKAGLSPDTITSKSNNVVEFTLEMKLYEMKEHILALKRIYPKYLSAEGDDKFDYVDSLANRFGYMVIAFQDIMSTIYSLNARSKKKEELSIRRVISEFQGIFEKECENQMIDNAVSSFSDRNEIVHMYENYQGNMENVLSNVENYLEEYENIWQLLWIYSEENNILKNK